MSARSHRSTIRRAKARPACSTLGDRTPREHRRRGQRLHRVTVATDQRRRERGGPAGEREGEAGRPGDRHEERQHAVPGGQRAVDVERGDDRAGGHGGPSCQVGCETGGHGGRAAGATAARLVPSPTRRHPGRRHGLVLDVGSGDKPHWRADVLVDRYVGAEHGGQRSGRAAAAVSRPLFDAEASAMPFADGAFDYACAPTSSSTSPTRPRWPPSCREWRGPGTWRCPRRPAPRSSTSRATCGGVVSTGRRWCSPRSRRGRSTPRSATTSSGRASSAGSTGCSTPSSTSG